MEISYVNQKEFTDRSWQEPGRSQQAEVQACAIDGLLREFQWSLHM